MGDMAAVIVALISTFGVIGAGVIAARAQKSSNTMRASLDAATAQAAAQSALYDGYGNLTGHYQTTLGDLGAQLQTMTMTARTAAAECADCRAELGQLQIENAQLRHELDLLRGKP